MNPVRFEAFSASNSIGAYHRENQDSYLLDEKNLLFGLADGVGGYQGAKIASSLAMELLQSSASKVTNEITLRDCIVEINDRIASKASDLGFWNMGTTISVAKVLQDKSELILANVGDSPILLFRHHHHSNNNRDDRDAALQSVYYDDSNRHSDPMRMSGIIQYLGLDSIDVHTRTVSYENGDDTLLLCSDGITDNLLNSPVKSMLETLVQTKSAKRIVEAAIEEGIKPDDMTAILVFL